MAPRTLLLILLVAGATVGNVLWTQTQLGEMRAVVPAGEEESGPGNPLLPAPAGGSLQEQEQRLLQEQVSYLETQVKALQQENSGLVDKLAAIGVKEKVEAAVGGQMKSAAMGVDDGNDNVSLGLELLSFRKLDDVPVATVETAQAEVEALILADLRKGWGADFGRREGAALAALGLIPEPVDTLPLRAGLLTRQMTGWYDSGSDTLNVVDAKRGMVGELIPADAVLAVTYGALQHRYGQALAEAGKLTTDERLARMAMFGGDAALTRFLYRLQKPAAPGPLDDFPADDPDHPLNQVVAPAFLREMMLFPLSEGFRFAQALHSIGGWEQVNAAYSRLPASTAEILSDEAYLADHSVPPPSIRWGQTELGGRKPFWDDRLGQQGIQLMLRRYNEPELASKVAAGWRMDRWLAFAGKDSLQRGDAVWQTRWATAEGARSFLAGMQEWLRQHYQVEVKAVGDAVSLTAGGRAVRLKLLTHGLNVLLVDAASAVAADAAVAQFSVVE